MFESKESEMSRSVRFSLLVCALLLVPAMAYAQASIAGIVRDSSGAVLPGVTIEAASPALIEKVRTAVTDGTGQYRIVDLRPGTYTLAFSLAGFSTSRREGIELAGTFTATINAQLTVGALEESVTVSGEAPAVDVQNTVRQRVMDREILDSLPISRSHTQLAVVLPGVTTTVEDVGGSSTGGQGAVVAHGSRGTDMNSTISGLMVGGPRAGGGGTNLVASNFVAYEEVTIDTGGVDAEHAAGGVRINQILRNGGNTFRGNFFGTYSTGGMQGDNYTDDLRNLGLGTPNTIKKLWDVNPGFGGPIAQNKVWFFFAARYAGAEQYPAGIFYNVNAGNPDAWAYAPDASRVPHLGSETKDASLRLTWQAASRLRVGSFWQQQIDCYCQETLSGTRALEAAFDRRQEPIRNVILDATSPLTNRLLLDVGMLFHRETVTRIPITRDPRIIAVTDQGLGNLNFRAFPDEVRNTLLLNKTGRAALSYITGAHTLKVGFHRGALGEKTRNDYATQPYSYRFNNGVPNQITLRAMPQRHELNIDNISGLFGEGRWTRRRLTFTYGLRYDHYEISFPETRAEPGPLVPNRNLVLPAAKGISWNDVSPRTGAAYDLFGTGKTALKVTLNRYLANIGAQNPIILGESMAPVRRLVVSTTRSWTDTNRNFVPDCDLIDPAINGECGAMANRNFGTTVPGASYDPDLVTGWGKREYNWEFSTGVQHEILPRVSVELSYFRRSYGNFIVTDNRALSPADFDSFSIAAPSNQLLPGGGGYQVSGLYNQKPATFGLPNDDYVTSADNYGKQTERWNGVDAAFNARTGGGMMLQGGVSTGRTTTDNCDIRAKLPEASPTSPFCHVQTKFLTNMKLMGIYVVPYVGVQLSAAFRSDAGPEVLADYVATNAVVAPSLGRNLSGGTTNVTVPLVEPGTIYGDRRNQLDVRVAKVLRLGDNRRVSPAVDIFNVFNANAVLTQSNAYATWRRPLSILFARFVKLSVTMDF